MEKILKQVLSQYYTELILEVEKAETLLKIKRIYDSGKVLEIGLKNLLLRLLPDYVGITRGIIFSSDAQEVSEEIDLILYDKRYFSGFIIDTIGTDTISLVSIDTVFGVISVKKTLDRKTVKDCIKNINSVYALNRKSIKNRLHHDIDLNGAITYKNGIELNRLFSCIVSFENDFAYKQVKGETEMRNNEEIQVYLDKLGKDGIFDTCRVDLTYSIDGVFMYPRILSANGFTRNAQIDRLGEIKEVGKFHLEGLKIGVSNPNSLVLSYSIDFDAPENALGQFMTYLQIYTSNLVKSSPDTLKIFESFFKAKDTGLEGTIQETCHINELLTRQK